MVYITLYNDIYNVIYNIIDFVKIQIWPIYLEGIRYFVAWGVLMSNLFLFSYNNRNLQRARLLKIWSKTQYIVKWKDLYKHQKIIRKYINSTVGGALLGVGLLPPVPLNGLEDFLPHFYVLGEGLSVV